MVDKTFMKGIEKMKKTILGLVLCGLVSVSNAWVTGVGSKQGYSDVLRYDSDMFSYNFTGGFPAGVDLSGDGSTDLDLYIYDYSGNLICQSTSSGDDEYCNWTPLWTGSFTIQVKNRGSVYNHYFIRFR